jgi:hypothetical protein
MLRIDSSRALQMETLRPECVRMCDGVPLNRGGAENLTFVDVISFFDPHLV